MNTHEIRERRQAQALAIVKAIRPPPAPKLCPIQATELPGTDPDAPGVVYFVYSAGRVKIGYTTDIKARMDNIGTHCPLPATLLLTIKGHPEDEKDFHDIFDDERAKGEWFNLSFRLREFLDCRFDCGTFVLMANAEEDDRVFFKAVEDYYPILNPQFDD